MTQSRICIPIVLPQHCRIWHFRRFISISHTVIDRFWRNSAKWVTSTNEWFRYIWERSNGYQDTHPEPDQSWNPNSNLGSLLTEASTRSEGSSARGVCALSALCSVSTYLTSNECILKLVFSFCDLQIGLRINGTRNLSADVYWLISHWYFSCTMFACIRDLQLQLVILTIIIVYSNRLQRMTGSLKI